jgi:hypothetical protein
MRVIEGISLSEDQEEGNQGIRKPGKNLPDNQVTDIHYLIA